MAEKDGERKEGRRNVVRKHGEGEERKRETGENGGKEVSRIGGGGRK